MNFCPECKGPTHPDIGCINPNCKHHRGSGGIHQRPTDHPEVALDVSFDSDQPHQTDPPSTRRPHDRPTKDLPPIQKALRDWLAKPESERSGWPDNDRCSNERCGNSLDFLWVCCPFCGCRRELPLGVAETLTAYERALRENSIPSMPIPAVPPPPDEPSLPPPPQPRRPYAHPGGYSTPSRRDPRAEEDDGVSSYREERVAIRVPLAAAPPASKKPIR